MLIWRLLKREDQALIQISTILKFSALDSVHYQVAKICMGSTKLEFVAKIQ